MNLLTGQAEMSVLPAGCSVELKLTERKFHSQSSIELQGLLFLFKNIGGHQSSFGRLLMATVRFKAQGLGLPWLHIEPSISAG